MELVNRSEIEAKAAGALARLGARQRRELERLLGNPPDPKRIPADWWLKSQKEIEETLAVLLLPIFQKSARQHGMDLADARKAAEAYAADWSKELAEDFRKGSQEILTRHAKEWDGERMTASAIRETTLVMLGPARMIGLAVTETTRAQHRGSETAVEAVSGLNENDLWITKATGVCSVCAPLDHQPRSVWSIQFPLGPPEPHKNCRCWIDYA